MADCERADLYVLKCLIDMSNKWFGFWMDWHRACRWDIKYGKEAHNCTDRTSDKASMVYKIPPEPLCK